MRAGGAVTPWHAWIYENGVVTNLNSLKPSGSGLHLAYATAINNAGQIAGVAYDAQARYHAFLLTPCGASCGPAPVVPAINVNDVTKPEQRHDELPVYDQPVGANHRRGAREFHDRQPHRLELLTRAVQPSPAYAPMVWLDEVR
jgi:probable HAF family extracellular repeat protein